MESGNLIRAIKLAVESGFTVEFSPDDREGCNPQMVIRDLRNSTAAKVAHMAAELVDDKTFDADFYYRVKLEYIVAGLTSIRR